MTEEPGRFIAVFGPAHMALHPVEGGVYPVPLAFCPHIDKGDRILCFCTKKYPVHGWTAPGFGVVTKIANRMNANGTPTVDIRYEYKSLNPPVTRDHIMKCLTPRERRQIQYPNVQTHWLRRIELTSAQCIGF